MERGRRSALCVAMVLVLLACGCGVVSVSEDEPARDAVPATARSVVDGVETWDLTGTPSGQAFGREDGDSAAIYQTDRPRPVRVLLPGGRTFTVQDASIVDFRSFGPDRPDNWAFGVSTAAGDLRSTSARLAGVLSELGMPTGVVTDFSTEASAAAGPDRVASTSEKARFGAVDLGVRATWRPTSERGSVDVSGSWGAAR